MVSLAYIDRPAERRSLRRGAIVSLVLHVIVLALLIGLWQRPEPIEAPIPVTIALVEGTGSSGASGGSGGAGGGTPEGEAQSRPAAGAATPASPSETTPTPPAATAEATPEPPPVMAPAPAATQAPPPKPTPPRPSRKPAAQTAHRAPAPTPPAERDTAPAPAAMAPPTPLAPAAPAPGSLALAAPGAPGMGGGVGGLGGAGRGDAGAGRAALGEGDPRDLGDEYLERLRRWLARFKHYPRAALDRKEEGQVIVGFTLARDGTVERAWIERSSGSEPIDQAALRMMHDGSPVPPIPPSYRGSRVTLTMPVDYSIGFFEKLFR